MVERFLRRLEQKEEQRKTQLGFAVGLNDQLVGSPRYIPFVSNIFVSSGYSNFDIDELPKGTRSREYDQHFGRI